MNIEQIRRIIKERDPEGKLNFKHPNNLDVEEWNRVRDELIKDSNKFTSVCKIVEADSYEEWVESRYRGAIAPTPPRLPAYIRILVEKDTNKIYGGVNLRFEIDEKLEKVGGHIGYFITPSMRAKGFAVLQLAKALELFYNLDINPIYVSCNEENIRSKRTIENFTNNVVHKEQEKDILTYKIDFHV